MTEPYIIPIPTFGNNGVGFIAIMEQKTALPFPVKRVFWTFDTPRKITRGRHAHRKSKQILVAVRGKITVYTRMPDGTKRTFVLDRPDAGLFIPPQAWHSMRYGAGAVQLVLASTEFTEDDYIRTKRLYNTVYGSKHGTKTGTHV